MAGQSKQSLSLNANKRALLEALLREEGLDGKTRQTIPRRKNSGPAPLSFAQQRLWFIDQLSPGSAAYNVVSAIRLEGKLNPVALEQSFNEVARRHEILRTTFNVIDDQPVQIVHPPAPVKLAALDLSGLPAAEQSAGVERMLSEEASLPFDLAQGPLLRIDLLRLNDEEHVLIFVMHHIIGDAWSEDILLREIGASYEAFAGGRSPGLSELPIQYADFACWQRQWLQGEVIEAQLGYWKERLSGNLPVIELPSDNPRPATQTYKGGGYFFSLPLALSDSVKKFSQSQEATLFMTLLAAFDVLLHRYTAQEDIIVGAPIANRNRAEIESLIGFFTNTLAIRVGVTARMTFRELLDRVREAALGAYTHQDLPFEHLVEQLNPQRDLSHNPIAQVLFVVRNSTRETIEFAGLTMAQIQSLPETAKFDLTLFLIETEQQMEGMIEYNADLFAQATIARMAGHFETLLEAILANPDEPVSSLPLLTKSERRQLLFDWNETAADYPRDRCAHQLFEEQVERAPDAAAIIFKGERLTYKELNARANQVAHRLRASGVGPDVFVGVCLERSIEMIVCVLGVLKAGGACLPLDPSYPNERLAFILEDARAPVVLTQKHLTERLHGGARMICLDEEWSLIAQESESNPQSAATTENLVYALYTSGSTGRPKGVALPHRALVNVVSYFPAESTGGSRTLQFATLNFDISFQEIFSTLRAGETLVLIEEAVRLDMPALGRLIDESRVRRVHLPVVVLQSLAEEFSEDTQHLANIRQVIVAGEQLQITRPVLNLFARLSDCELHNHYGPTETHVMMGYRLQGAPDAWPKLPPIGRPFSNTRAYILDSNLQPLPVIVPGELFIGGVCLARGYVNAPDLTADRFIPDPFSGEPGARLYRTGDISRYLPDGNIEFLGRNDHQIKIRGIRVEPGEIEAALKNHPAIQEAAVAAFTDAMGQKRLAAYIVRNQERELTTEELRRHLGSKLPEYMIPSAFTALESMPLTPSGKLDRRALPAPDKSVAATRQEYVAPRNAVEEAVAAIWAEVLRIERAGIRDNFFDLGGHSLMATQITSRIRKNLQVDVPLRKLFEGPTVAALSEAVIAAETKPGQAERIALVLKKIESMSFDDVKGELQKREQREA